MPRPGSHKYDIKRARIRKQLEDEGIASDQDADEEANRRLQQDEEHRPRATGERARGPEGER